MKDQQIDFNITLYTLATKDEPAEVIPGSIPGLIGKMLVNPSFKLDGAVRKLLLAQKISEHENITVNKADFDLIINAIKHAEGSYGGEVIGGLLLYLEAIKWEA